MVGTNGVVDLKINTDGQTTVVSFNTASISNTETITSAAEQIKKFIEDNRPQKIVFDFGGVKFFCSQVLGMLLEVRSKMQTYNGELVISAINPSLHRVFKITNLDKIFKFFPDIDSAIKAANVN